MRPDLCPFSAKLIRRRSRPKLARSRPFFGGEVHRPNFVTLDLERANLGGVGRRWPDLCSMPCVILCQPALCAGAQAPDRLGRRAGPQAPPTRRPSPPPSREAARARTPPGPGRQRRRSLSSLSSSGPRACPKLLDFNRRRPGPPPLTPLLAEHARPTGMHATDTTPTCLAYNARAHAICCADAKPLQPPGAARDTTPLEAF